VSDEQDDDNDESMDAFEFPSAGQLQHTSLMGVPPDTLNTWRLLMVEFIKASDADRPMLWRNLLNYITAREFH
tara:strand:- start:51 stop:269 length:219 start_codon:yes stop_codon:yes gene_type:complete